MLRFILRDDRILIKWAKPKAPRITDTAIARLRDAQDRLRQPTEVTACASQPLAAYFDYRDRLIDQMTNTSPWTTEWHALRNAGISMQNENYGLRSAHRIGGMPMTEYLTRLTHGHFGGLSTSPGAQSSTSDAEIPAGS